MRVVIEATPLSLPSGGLARYTSELSRALARRFPEDQFLLSSDQPFAAPAEAPGNLRCDGGPRRGIERRWWLWGLGRKAARWSADVIHGPDFAVPYLPLRPSVLTLHDLSPWMDPKWHRAAGRVKRRTPVLLKLRIPTMVITDTETVRKQAIERFRIPPQRIVTVPLAAPSWLMPRKTAATCGAGRPYFLFVGTLEPRKNLPALINAWREVRRDHNVDLVLAGRRRQDAPPLTEEPGLRILGEIADEKLPELYTGALAFVFPSLYEGFGLPVLEAMQCGACVIASPAVREAGGMAAVYAVNQAELVERMRQAVLQPQWLDERKRESLARAREFSWERTAQLTHEVYQEASKRFGR